MSELNKLILHIGTVVAKKELAKLYSGSKR